MVGGELWAVGTVGGEGKRGRRVEDERVSGHWVRYLAPRQAPWGSPRLLMTTAWSLFDRNDGMPARQKSMVERYEEKSTARGGRSSIIRSASTPFGKFANEPLHRPEPSHFISIGRHEGG